MVVFLGPTILSILIHLIALVRIVLLLLSRVIIDLMISLIVRIGLHKLCGLLDGKLIVILLLLLIIDQLHGLLCIMILHITHYIMLLLSWHVNNLISWFWIVVHIVAHEVVHLLINTLSTILLPWILLLICGVWAGIVLLGLLLLLEDRRVGVSEVE